MALSSLSLGQVEAQARAAAQGSGSAPQAKLSLGNTEAMAKRAQLKAEQLEREEEALYQSTKPQFQTPIDLNLTFEKEVQGLMANFGAEMQQLSAELDGAFGISLGGGKK